VACRSTSYEAVANREGERLRELGNKPGAAPTHPASIIHPARSFSSGASNIPEEGGEEEEAFPGFDSGCELFGVWRWLQHTATTGTTKRWRQAILISAVEPLKQIFLALPCRAHRGKVKRLRVDTLLSSIWAVNELFLVQCVCVCVFVCVCDGLEGGQLANVYRVALTKARIPAATQGIHAAPGSAAT
jgi:hypothetical protein